MAYALLLHRARHHRIYLVRRSWLIRTAQRQHLNPRRLLDLTHQIEHGRDLEATRAARRTAQYNQTDVLLTGDLGQFFAQPPRPDNHARPYARLPRLFLRGGAQKFQHVLDLRFLVDHNRRRHALQHALIEDVQKQEFRVAFWQYGSLSDCVESAVAGRPVIAERLR